MRKAIVVSFSLAIGCAFTSQAVVIHWAVDNPQSGTSSAILVYVSSGAPTYADGAIANGVELGTAVSGLAITPAGIGEQATTDATPRSTGNYYVVLFNDLSQYSVSSALAYNDASALTYDAMAPLSGSGFNPSSFGDWTAVPEPSTATLLCLGAAAAILRRRKRV